MYLDHFLAIIFSIILIGGLVLLFLKSIKKSKAVINETETKYQNMRTEIDAQTKQLANKFGLSVVPTNSNNLKQIQTAVLNRYKEAEREFLEKMP